MMATPQALKRSYELRGFRNIYVRVGDVSTSPMEQLTLIRLALIDHDVDPNDIIFGVVFNYDDDGNATAIVSVESSVFGA